MSPPDVLALARHHGEEFLDETAKLAGSAPKQQVWDSLKRSRAVVMELVSALTPRPSSAPISESRSITFSDDLKTVRNEIFSVTTEDPNWHMGLLSAVATAQRMGAEHFEMTVKTEQGNTRPRQNFFLNPYSMGMQLYGSEWQGQIVPVSTIKVYAVGIR